MERGVGMELNPEQLARAIAAVRENKQAPDGPVLAAFVPEELAAAIESECARTAHLQNSKITLHMDPVDAMLLARYLRWRSMG